MLRRIDLRDRPGRGGGGDPAGRAAPALAGCPVERDLLPRAALDVESAAQLIAPVLDAVRERGSAAVVAASERFDGVSPPALRVPTSVLADARAALGTDLERALMESIRRARIGHEAQRRTDVTTTIVPGGTVTERWVPVGRVGLYVPGGLAPLASSVVMNVVPAQVAGVTSLAVASPPQREYGGWPAPTILAACCLLGVDEVYAVGGAQAIALLAHGLPAGDPVGPVAPVDLITGPGNRYVTAAKRLVRSVVGIDADAGPTEIAILADNCADPRYVAADLVSQAEHDPLAAAVLVTDSAELAAAVDAELERQVAVTRHTERVRAALSGEQSGVVLVRDIAHGIAAVDAYAAEHLEVITRDARSVAARVRSAGCVFIGPFSPVSLGDYCAGSNHVLPTGGTARYSSGLSVQTFLRGSHVVEYDQAALADAASHVQALAAAEDLPAHGAAVAARGPT